MPNFENAFHSVPQQTHILESKIFFTVISINKDLIPKKSLNRVKIMCGNSGQAAGFSNYDGIKGQFPLKLIPKMVEIENNQNFACFDHFRPFHASRL